MRIKRLVLSFLLLIRFSSVISQQEDQNIEAFDSLLIPKNYFGGCIGYTLISIVEFTKHQSSFSYYFASEGVSVALFYQRSRLKNWFKLEMQYGFQKVNAEIKGTSYYNNNNYSSYSIGVNIEKRYRFYFTNYFIFSILQHYVTGGINFGIRYKIQNSKLLFLLPQVSSSTFIFENLSSSDEKKSETSVRFRTFIRDLIRLLRMSKYSGR